MESKWALISFVKMNEHDACLEHNKGYASEPKTIPRYIFYTVIKSLQ